MKAAIPLFGKRISPRFDCAQSFVLVTILDQSVTSRQNQSIEDSMPFVKAQRLKDLNVDTLICNGVDEGTLESLKSLGIRVLSDIRGEVDEVIDLYIGGKLDN